ncbi:DUF397 domain-containing protein [Thermomonospora cellulosilytica]|uniref:DUF397 domain-containing protein n=1 Tax=Thermomonospora cellulosilytica TaxID=1411118 RepID=A0A7W3R7B9_9ACTN|nr:DUF397 domain-containing protein [Thermomonospora cellulosilytica]MBA9002522.1 hypothetical protein [Thermomonospora cellulosilytica]
MGNFPSLRRSGWRKSSYSGGGSNSCVELADLGRVVGIRDSKDPEGPVLSVTRDGLAALLEAARRA